jgi:2-polyprenyl-6-methoxyphenol hydroxylase-like FAD-dependent oxidoreductase
MQEFHTEVLIIGAGPTGLFCAGELARHGVKARIIDQTLAPHTQTRATEIQPAVLETLHRAGLAEKFMESSLPMRGLRVFDVNMNEAFILSIPAGDSPYPDTRSMPQWRTEEILLGNLSALGVEVERGTTAKNILLSEDGARVECVDRDGREFVIVSDYLVGAGGAHSPTRGALNQRLQGITYPKRYFVADVSAPGFHRGGHLISVAIGSMGLVMMIELPEGRSLLLTDISDDHLVEDQPGIEDARKAVIRHLPNSFEISDVRWASVYRMHRRQSPKFAQGRCFLAGDAAHICSPLGGEGLNSGLLDAASLAWKLAAVLRCGGKPSLLGAYETERQEIARQVLTSSDAMHDYYDVLIDQVVRGDTLAEPADDPTRKVTSGSMLDLSLSDSPLLGFHGFYRTNAPIRPGHRFPEQTRLSGLLHHLLVYRDVSEWDAPAFAKRWANALEIVEGSSICPPERSGVPDGGAVLVRPDGYIAFQAQDWNDDARKALDELLFTQFHPL